MGKRTITLTLAAGLAVMLGAVAPAQAASPRVEGQSRQTDGTAPWLSFGFNAAHSSVNVKATTITSANAASLTQAWQFVTPPPTMTGQPGVGFDGSPVVADGMVFIGSATGVFYALNEDTGAVVWSLNAGFRKPVGIAGTATIANDPTTGKPAVYFADSDGVLSAVDVASGAVIWQSHVYPATSSPANFIWGSPLVYQGTVYVGIASEGDNPLVRGGLASFSQKTGAHVATFWTVKSTAIGGAIWSSPAASSAGVFVSTGNANESAPATAGLSNSIVLLDPVTLKAKGHWTVPNIATVDDDFGSSPTLFTAKLNGVATPMVGACDKNGVFYALKQTNLAAGPVWSIQLGIQAAQEDSCIATASWNGTHLLITTNTSTVGGVTYPAVSRELDPATGAPIWQAGLADGPVAGNSAIDGAGVLAAVTYSRKSPATTNDLALLSASTGQVLATYPTPTLTGGGPVFADGYLLFGGADGILHAYFP